MYKEGIFIFLSFSNMLCNVNTCCEYSTYAKVIPTTVSPSCSLSPRLLLPVQEREQEKEKKGRQQNKTWHHFVLVPMLFSDEYLFAFCMCNMYVCVCRYRCFDKYWLISAFCMYYKCFGIISYLLKIFTNMTILHVSPYTLLIQIKQVNIWHRYFTYY